MQAYRFATLFVILAVPSLGPSYATSLEDVYQLSLTNDPRFQAANYRYEAALQLVPQARSELLPDARVHFEHTETDQNIKSSDNEVFAVGSTEFPSQEYGLILTQPIFRWGDWQRLKQSQAEVKRAYVEYTAASQDLILRASELYLNVLAAEDNVEFVQAEKRSVKKQLDLTVRRRESGLATRTDLYDAQARFALVEANETEARDRLEDSYQALRETTGEFLTDLEVLEEEIPLMSPEPRDIDEWVASAQTQNLELEVRRQDVEIAQREVRRQKAGHYPTLDFIARYNDRDTDGSLFGGGSEVETTDLSIRFSVPIYQGGAVRAEQREALNLLGEAEEQLKAQHLSVTRETRAAYLGVLSAITRVNALTNSVLAQEAAVESKQKGFRAGLNTGINVLDAERDLYLIRRDFAQARYDYLLNFLRLKRATGSLSENDLMQVNGMLEAPAP